LDLKYSSQIPYGVYRFQKEGDVYLGVINQFHILIDHKVGVLRVMRNKRT
jgi:hypothetical protein